VTVSLLEKNQTNTYNLDKRDVRVIFSKGSGPGGQNKNKVVTCVELRHEPTGISVRIDGRSRKDNEDVAWAELEKRLNDLSARDNSRKNADIKRGQIGISNRANKIRTYNEKMGMVINHLNDKTITFRDLYKGNIEKLY
jgi:peptide chain release factor 1